ncbi:MAG: ATP-binding protein [Thermoleophilaceae bacterium]
MASPIRTAPDSRPLLAGTDARVRFAIPGGPHAPECARMRLQSHVTWLPEDAHKQLLLLTSELVTNAVRHGGSQESDRIGMAVWATDDGVGVEVTDAGPGFTPGHREGDVEDPGGWGLVLVESMSDRWGVVRDQRTHVWFELSAA